MADRRPMGALEAEVLGVLWDHEAALTPAQVMASLDGELAYTTVMTILARLWKKDLVERERAGRAFAYRPVVSEADLAARRMHATLEATSDQAAALSRFVRSLSAKDARKLRRLLEDGPK
jgi:predicted transcriptional regulator